MDGLSRREPTGTEPTSNGPQPQNPAAEYVTKVSIASELSSTSRIVCRADRISRAREEDGSYS